MTARGSLAEGTVDGDTDRLLRALSAVRFNWAATPDDVFDADSVHIDGLQPAAERELLDGMEAAWRSRGPSPIGLVLSGSKGVGKTHLLGWIRQQVQQGDGYFFLVQHLADADFWRSVTQGILDGLLRRAHCDRDQLTLLLRTLGDKIEADAGLRSALLGERPVDRGDLDAFVTGLRRIDRQLGESADVARALLLYASPDLDQSDIGRAFVSLGDELDLADRAAWGLQRGARSPQLIVRDLSRLLAASGEPTVIAVDQLDTLIAQSRSARATPRTAGTAPPTESEQFERMLDSVADGLMALREETRRTLTVLSLLPTSWALLLSRSVAAAGDRFRELKLLEALPGNEKAAEFLAAHLGFRYATVDVEPPYPTWPIAEGALAQASRYTARELLQRVDAHARSCVETGIPTPLDDLSERESTQSAAASVPLDSAASGLDDRFAAYRAAADVPALLDPAAEDSQIPGLLRAALVSFVAEAGGREWAIDPPRPRKKPALHARLRLVLDPATEDEQHWAFRAVFARHHRAVQTRLQDARVAAGVAAGMDRRRLVLLRNDPWPKGPRTAEMVEGILDTSGEVLPLSEADVRTFSALRRMLDDDAPGTQGWLADRRPAGRSDLLSAALGDVDIASTRPPQAEPPVAVVAPDHAIERRPDVIVLGRSVADGSTFAIPMAALNRHAVVFAGSGSGKTVLLRRIIEECALRGVSSIVLDVNNDLVRLADAWETPHPGWWSGDAERAADFHDNTDVVVWTPGRLAGRPLSLRALPDFAQFLDDPDEFHDAITAAVASLAPRARLMTPSPKVDQSRAVLRQALEAFARGGQEGLKDFIDFLRYLPAEATRIGKGQKIAGELAETLTAAMINDPLFGGGGETADPGVLLTPAPGKRARVSVVNLLGLPTPETKESFVNELQLALFAWVKANPAPDGTLGGLFVMDEAQNFVSSRGTTPFGETTVALVSQARKYGLGMLFATQAPKNLDNRIPGNATTQIVGLLSAPVQIEAVRELARARGSDIPDVARLGRGTFYMATEGTPFVRTTAPMCLSAHTGPATVDEVIARATRER